MERKQEYWAFLVVNHIDFIVIPGKILRSGHKIPIVKPGISLTRRSLNWGCAPYILLYLFRGTNVYRYTGNIVKPKIVKPGVPLYLAFSPVQKTKFIKNTLNFKIHQRWIGWSSVKPENAALLNNELIDGIPKLNFWVIKTPHGLCGKKISGTLLILSIACIAGAVLTSERQGKQGQER